MTAPYDSVKELLPYDPSGWYANATPMEALIRKIKPKVVIELGSWKGTSTLHIAGKIPDGGVVYAVDHWFCPPYDQEIPVWYQKFDIDHLYQQFLSNVIHAGLTDAIVPVRMGTLDAVSYFLENGIKADLIYVDASHDEESVYADLNAYYPFLRGGGVLCGDDWSWGPGWGWSEDHLPVQSAVNRFAKERGLKVSVYNATFWSIVVKASSQ